jgi:nitrate/TMAO reductase-like tetraheme cytochrome c subunit
MPAILSGILRHWLGLVGVALVTTAGILWMFLLPTLLRGAAGNPYLGILAFGLLPALFFLGLILMPVGAWLARRRDGKAAIPRTLSFTDPVVRRAGIFLLVTTLANLIIGSQLIYSATHYMSSNEFCGTACHNLMTPEYTAHKVGKHANVECVQCHVEPGAKGYMKAKLNGLNQLAGFLRNHYPKPVRAGEGKLPSTDTTCGGCHSLKGMSEEKLIVQTKYSEDEKNSIVKTVIVVYPGKIHRMHGPEGPMKLECIECHNRAAHAFEDPNVALDKAMAEGAIDVKLPFAKKVALEALKLPVDSAAEVEKSFAGHYAGLQVAKSASAVGAIWARNVFPAMKVSWGTHVSKLGHDGDKGCFQCHTGKADGAGQDCSTCHNLAAMDEPSPKVLSDLLGK